MPTTQAPSANHPSRKSSWLSFLRPPICEHCGAKQPRRPFQRPYAWCWKCEALLDPEQVLLGEAGTMLLDWRILAKHPEPVTKLIGMIVLVAVADGAEEVIFEPTADELRIWCRVEQNTYELVPPPYEMHEAIVQVLKAISKVDPHQSGPAAGQFGILLHDDGDVIQRATTEFASTEFGDRAKIRFLGALDPRAEPRRKSRLYLRELLKRESDLDEMHTATRENP
jgi:hypothetical protein